MIVEWNHQYDVQDVIEMTSKHGKDVVVITNEKQAVEKINSTYKPATTMF